MDKKLKIALIGAGGIATYAHAPAYEKMDNVEIIGVLKAAASLITRPQHSFLDGNIKALHFLYSNCLVLKG